MIDSAPPPWIRGVNHLSAFFLLEKRASCIYTYLVRTAQSPLDSQAVCKKMARECMALRLRLISRVVTAIYDGVLRAHGVTINQLNLLVAISRIGDSASAKQVGQVLRMEPSTVSRNLDRMKQEGWLRVASGTHERTRRLKLTRKGERLVLKASTAWEEAQKITLELLGDANFHTAAHMASTIWCGHE